MATENTQDMGKERNETIHPLGGVDGVMLEDEQVLSELDELLGTAEQDTLALESLCDVHPDEQHMEALIRILDLESQVETLKDLLTCEKRLVS